MATNSLKTGPECEFQHPKWSRAIFAKKHLFGPFLTHFQFQNGPFEGLLGPNSASKRSKTGSKQPENVSLSAPNGLGSFLEIPSSGPFQTHSGPIWGHLGPFGAKRHCTVDRVKTGKTQVKGTPQVARVDSTPRHGHWTAPAPNLEPSCPVWSHLGAKLASERTRGRKTRITGRDRTPKMVAWGPGTHPGGRRSPTGSFNC